MPTYQYRCTACGKELEAVQKFSDPALTTCPACSGDLRKVYSAVGVVFKGSGFYATDSRTSNSTSKPASVPESGKDKKESAPTPTKSTETTTTAS
ncbi:FmdB family zinc ribbon protein [[Pseudopropionibacterium] massiliense]|uniref:FmdB family zinc ribbon protein n=1 Tax=[Pseudopropionibacterium] massiliense TaxID=2220000 RepID=UPI001031529A|nr:FmdB family zinc ribbon protein [[Pseudopropionibacterium] massiliense]